MMLSQQISRIGCWLALVVLLLTACDGPSVQTSMIGSSVQVGSSSISTSPIAQYAHPIGQAVIVQTANSELVVSQIDQVEPLASGLASKYGGTISGSQHWRQDGRAYATLMVTVPAYQFEAMHRGLVGLGELQSERISETVVVQGTGRPFSRITVRLISSRPQFNPPEVPSGSWSHQRFFNGAVAGLGKLVITWVKTVAWLAQAMAPFILIGLGILIFMKRGQKG